MITPVPWVGKSEVLLFAKEGDVPVAWYDSKERSSGLAKKRRSERNKQYDMSLRRKVQTRKVSQKGIRFRW